jgi:hypothetical protein
LRRNIITVSWIWSTLVLVPVCFASSTFFPDALDDDGAEDPEDRDGDQELDEGEALDPAAAGEAQFGGHVDFL